MACDMIEHVMNRLASTYGLYKKQPRSVFESHENILPNWTHTAINCISEAMRNFMQREQFIDLRLYEYFVYVYFVEDFGRRKPRGKSEQQFGVGRLFSGSFILFTFTYIFQGVLFSAISTNVVKICM